MSFLSDLLNDLGLMQNDDEMFDSDIVDSFSREVKEAIEKQKENESNTTSDEQ